MCFFSKARGRVQDAGVRQRIVGLSANVLLQDRQVNFFIDNMSGLCAIVKGASRRDDLASLANGLWFGLATFRTLRLGSTTWKLNRTVQMEARGLGWTFLGLLL